MDERIGAMHLPQAVVARILKDEDITASKESRETIGRAAAVFLINLSGIACKNAMDNKHKTISAEDVLKALRTFDNNAIYQPCKQAVDEWKILKQQKSLAKKNQENSQDDITVLPDNHEDSPDLPETME